MPRCNCPGSACGCLVQGGLGVQVEGTGNRSAPYIISVSSAYVVVDKEFPGQLDLTQIAQPGGVVEVNQSADGQAIILPDLPPGSSFELIIRLLAGGLVVFNFTPTVRWPLGGIPALNNGMNTYTWIRFRKTSDTYWLAELVGTGIE